MIASPGSTGPVGTDPARRGRTRAIGAAAAVLLGLVAALLALVAAGVLAAVVAGVIIGGLTYGVAALAARGQRELTSAGPRPRRGSPAEVWLHRAEKAVRTLDTQASTAQGEVLRDQVAGVDHGATTVLDAMRRLAAQVTAVEDALYRIDAPRIAAEQTRLAGENPPEGSERTDTADTLAEQLAIAERLRATRETLLARMQSSAIGLEGLVARLAEVLALAQTAGGIDTSERQIRGLSDELDGLRAGLLETERVSRRALGSG